MNFKKLTLAASVATLLVGGCATTAHDVVTGGKATVIPGTVNVRPYGSNYMLSALVEVGGERKRFETFATDCQKEQGALRSSGRDVYIDNNILNGPKPSDKLFTEICEQGMPEAYRLNDANEERRAALTPAQRAAEDQRRAAAANAVLQHMLQTQQQERRDAAIRDAIRESKKSTTVCRTDRSGEVSCETR